MYLQNTQYPVLSFLRGVPTPHQTSPHMVKGLDQVPNYSALSCVPSVASGRAEFI